MSTTYRGKRSWLKSPYHYDAFFGIRTHLNRMEYQLGQLIRTQDADQLLIGQREVAIERVLRNNQTEGMPDKKLQTPSISANIFDIIF